MSTLEEKFNKEVFKVNDKNEQLATENKQLKEQLEQQQSQVDYISIMTGVEL